MDREDRKEGVRDSSRKTIVGWERWEKVRGEDTEFWTGSIRIRINRGRVKKGSGDGREVWLRKGEE